MGRQKCCKICTSEAAITGQVNALIESGVKQRIIHEQHPEFSVSQISRHTRFCLQSKVAEITAPAASAEIQRWLERAESTFLIAQSNGDARSASSAISVAVRALSGLAKQVERETAAAEKAAADPNDVSFTVQQLDALIRQQAERGVIQNGIMPRILTLASEESSFRELVQKIWANRAILPALLATSENFLPERVTENANANN